MWSILDFSRCADRHFVLTFVEVGCYARTFIAWILVAAALVSAIGAVVWMLRLIHVNCDDPLRAIRDWI